MLRRIKTENESKRIQKRNKIILGVIMIALLGAAPLGYSLLSQDTSSYEDGGDYANGASIKEAGYDFFYTEGQWRFDQNGQVYGLNYLPSEVEDIEVEGIYGVNDYVSQVIYIVDGDAGSFEVLNNLGRYALRYQEACISEEDCSGDFPVKTCSDSVIIFEAGNETFVYKEDSCVYIVGDPIKGADAFLYKVLKVN